MRDKQQVQMKGTRGTWHLLPANTGDSEVLKLVAANKIRPSSTSALLPVQRMVAYRTNIVATHELVPAGKYSCYVAAMLNMTCLSPNKLGAPWIVVQLDTQVDVHISQCIC